MTPRSSKRPSESVSVESSCSGRYTVALGIGSLVPRWSTRPWKLTGFSAAATAAGSGGGGGLGTKW